MNQIKLGRKIDNLKKRIQIAGHRAYSIDNIDSPSAVKAFEKLESLKSQLKELQSMIVSPTTPHVVFTFNNPNGTIISGTFLLTDMGMSEGLEGEKRISLSGTVIGKLKQKVSNEA